MAHVLSHLPHIRHPSSCHSAAWHDISYLPQALLHYQVPGQEEPIGITWNAPHPQPFLACRGQLSFPEQATNQGPYIHTGEWQGTFLLLAGPHCAGHPAHSRYSINPCYIWIWSEGLLGAVVCTAQIIQKNKWAFLSQQTLFATKFTLNCREKKKKESLYIAYYHWEKR
jgi:hypothetical protein